MERNVDAVNPIPPNVETRRKPIDEQLAQVLEIMLAQLKELGNMQKTQPGSQNTFRGNSILWIEKLLQTPIDDYRKNSVNLILAPYLVNIKKLSYDTALNIINDWLTKCGKLRQLDQNFDYTVRYALKYSRKNGQRPLKLDTLKSKNLMLYNLVKPE